MQNTILISGVSGTIGRFLATGFLALGYAVIGISRREFLPENHADRYRHFSIDLTQEREVVGFAKVVRSEHIVLNAFIHCAGVSASAPTTIVNSESLSKTIGLNFEASVVLMREVLKLMVAQKRGAVINMSSITASMLNPGSAVYGSSKVAFEHFCKLAAIENGRYGIRVNTLRLPVIEQTTMQGDISKDLETRIADRTILKRNVELSEILSLCQWLISDDAKIITGEVFSPGGVC